MDSNIQYDNSVSFAKGIGILLMVLGHTYFSAYGYALIYMFHMPLFFFLSGYCFKQSHLDDFRSYARKRISKIYIPFVKWGLIFLLLHNLFFHLNIYNDVYGFNGVTSGLYGLSDYLKKTVFILFCLSGNEQLLGGYWFLHTMFFASFIFYGLLKIKKPVVGGLIALLLSTLLFYKGIPIVNIYCGPKELFAVSCMMVGYLYKSYRIENLADKYRVYVIPSCILLLILGSLYWNGEMLDMKWTHTFPYFISAMAGSILVLMVSKYLVSKTHHLSDIISTIGNKTIEILTWHFLCFKIVSLIIIRCHDLPVEHLAEFPVMAPYNVQGWWICYLVVGVGIPVVGAVFFERVGKLVRR